MHFVGAAHVLGVIFLGPLRLVMTLTTSYAFPNLTPHLVTLSVANTR